MTLDEWQNKIDADFPAGAVVRLASGDGGPSDGYVFKTTGLTVTSVDGDVPTVRFWDSGVDKDFVVKIQKYESVRTNPVRVVRIEGADPGQVFLLGGGLTPTNVQIGWMATRRVERDTALAFA